MTGIIPPSRWPNGRRPCTWPDDNCRCPECATPTGTWHGATNTTPDDGDDDT